MGEQHRHLCYNVFQVTVSELVKDKQSMPETDKELKPIVACVTVGPFQENCYLYACPQTLEAVIIDPGDEAERIIQRIQELEFIPKYIINTHGHIDHICAIDEVSAVYPVPLAIHPADASMYTDERTAKILQGEVILRLQSQSVISYTGLMMTWWFSPDTVCQPLL